MSDFQKMEKKRLEKYNKGDCKPLRGKFEIDIETTLGPADEVDEETLRVWIEQDLQDMGFDVHYIKLKEVKIPDFE